MYETEEKVRRTLLVITGPLTARAALLPLRRLREKATKSERNSEMRDGNRAIVTWKPYQCTISYKLLSDRP